MRCQARCVLGLWPTVWVPHSTSDELHGRRAQRIVFWELELGCKDTTLEGSTSGALDQSFPVEHVILRDGASRDALGWVCGKVLVLVKETLLSDRGSHDCEGREWVES